MIYVILTIASVCAQADPADIQTVDFASPASRELWTHHPVWGDPSFDSFERLPGNPVVRGAPPYDWPVNGFFFEDPPTGHWYLYVGNYLEGYRLDNEHRSICTAFRSTDHGGHWEPLGPVLQEDPFFFEGERSPLASAPDVSMVYEDGLYHMCFDWASRDTTWENAANPGPESNSGVAYARAVKPEGPFTPYPRPIATTRDQEPLLGKYRRLYASSLIRRARDWLVLTLTDSGPWFGWALVSMTSENAEGPYTPPGLLLYPESSGYHPPLLEFFPAFVHEGFVYMPATSVALNRNFQCLFKAPLEEAHRPEAWRMEQHGSVWHALPVENEYHGIWGQTFSGFVDAAGFLNVLFPSRDRDGKGTINLARRPWDRPYREQGFVLSGHRGPSLALTTLGGEPHAIQLSMTRHGTVGLLWDAHGPLGANAPRSDASLHPLANRSRRELRFTGNTWSLFHVDDAGNEAQADGGEFNEDSGATAVEITWDEERATIALNGSEVWQGPLPAGNGAFGLSVAPDSTAEVTSFVVRGSLAPVTSTLLYTEALLGAAQGFTNWEPVTSTLFRYGEGAVSKPGATDACLKWNFIGRNFTLWAPTGPKYGKAELALNGVPLTTLDFYGEEETGSRPLYTHESLQGRYQAVQVKPLDSSIIPADCLEFCDDLPLPLTKEENNS